jgi:hypothetical protein
MYEVFDVRPLFAPSEWPRLDLTLPWAVMPAAGQPGWIETPVHRVASEDEARALANMLESAAAQA